MNTPETPATVDLSDTIKNLGYPGRILVVAKTTDNNLAVCFGICGRTESSRGVQFALNDDKSVSVIPHNHQQENALHHYRAIVRSPHRFFAGNGTHIDVLASRVAQGLTPAESFHNLSYEQDAPAYTPRISAYLDDRGNVIVGTAYAPRTGGDTAECQSIHTTQVDPGTGFLLTTYHGDVAEPQTQRSIMRVMVAAADITELAEQSWAALPTEQRVSLVGIAPHLKGQPMILSDDELR